MVRHVIMISIVSTLMGFIAGRFVRLNKLEDNIEANEQKLAAIKACAVSVSVPMADVIEAAEKCKGADWVRFSPGALVEQFCGWNKSGMVPRDDIAGRIRALIPTDGGQDDAKRREFKDDSDD